MNRLVDQLGRLPGLGRRSAQRIAFFLLKSSTEEALALASAIHDFKTDLKICGQCGNVADVNPCSICTDTQRDPQTILVVEHPGDIVQLETTGQYRGVYHVLMGHLSPLDGIRAGDLNIEPLLERVTTQDIQEVILGLHPTQEGDGTAMYLADQLHAAGVNVSRLARGLPVGASLDSVSKAVLGDAIAGRNPMNAMQ